MPKKQREKAGNHTINMDPRAKPTQESGNQYYQQKEDENHHIFAEVPTKGISCENTIPEAILDEEKETREDPQFISEMIEQRGTTNTNAASETARHYEMATISIEKETDQPAEISEPLQKPAELFPKPPPMSIHSDNSSPLKVDDKLSDNSEDHNSIFECTPEKLLPTDHPKTDKVPSKVVETSIKTIGKAKAPPFEDRWAIITNKLEERNKDVEKLTTKLNRVEQAHQNTYELITKIDKTVIDNIRCTKDVAKIVKQLVENINSTHAVNKEIQNDKNSTLAEAKRTITLANSTINSNKDWNNNTQEAINRHVCHLSTILPRMEAALHQPSGYYVQYQQENPVTKQGNVAPKWNEYNPPKDAIENTNKGVENTCAFCGLKNHTSEQCRRVSTWFDRREKLTEQKKCHQCLEVYETVEFCGTRDNHTNCPMENTFCKYCKTLKGNQPGWKEAAAHHPAVCEHAPKEHNTHEPPMKKGRIMSKRTTSNRGGRQT
ncbi:CCHC-type domain-containing protein [Caenorhabditis elegans]|uniref:CCHC-type domain-containing protein n=1 Tax=Caenorhabditis elegans TaxID=6239 RepID=Q93513_CAEEL|nr:CCHC-type domain-containing protein [Caenorhabditis elegans]CAB02488.2 CCHC-type domain-containing protein [Caenorhabditis elegans]|eukprot:NP_496806.2 Uncharacterized protein CELE_F15D4.5 [Caenorhabditis elegans]